MTKPAILVLDSDQGDIDEMFAHLSEDYDLSIHRNPINAALMAQERTFDVIIVDFHIPDINGLQFIDVIRPRQQKAIVIVTCRNATAADVQQALRLHVTDFIFKPIEMEELRRQIALGLMQRLPPPPPVEKEKTVHTRDSIILGALHLDIEHRVIEWHGESLLLTPTEFCILHTLALYLGQFVPASVLIRRCRNYDIDDSEAGELIKPHIANLRHKLEINGKYERIIVNKRGLGFLLKLPDSEGL